MSKRRHITSRTSAGKESPSLPALSSLIDVPAYADLHPSASQQRAFTEVCERIQQTEQISSSELELACVVRLDRGYPALVSPTGLVRAEFSATLSKAKSGRAPQHKTPDDYRVAVGDWVVLRHPAEHDKAVLEAVLPRESDIARWRGKARGEHQTLAANVDIVLIAQPISERPVLLDRIVRSAVVALDCGATPAVVLTKADRASSPEALLQDVARVHDVLPDVRIVATSAPHVEVAVDEDQLRAAGATWGTKAVAALVAPGQKAIVLGESGAGKSTLLNALLGREVLETGAVRASDDAGRHTTVARRMVRLASGAILVDEPGLRSLPLIGHERGLTLCFPTIAEAAQACKFRDCTHTHEPGCGVLAACDEGAISVVQLEQYRALAAEMRESAQMLDPDVRL